MRAFVLALLVTSVFACRRLPPPASSPTARPSAPPASVEPPPRAASDSASPSVAAIVDSIRRAVRDSMDTVAGRDAAARAARRDSAAAAARDSIAATARRDSIEAARRDSIRLAAARDSIAAVARRDSIAAVRADSIAAATLDSIRSARADSIAGTIVDSIVAARAAREAGRTDEGPARGRQGDAREEERPDDDQPVDDDVEELRALGPAFIPYDEGPRARWDTETQATLTRTLLPVLRREGLGARTRTTFWVLISARGEVAEVVLQTTSGSEAFDEAAAGFARQLRFQPATRSGRPAAVWVLREFSIVMQ